MKLQHKSTGDIVEIPPPNQFGHSTVVFNGRIVERVIYSDEPGKPTVVTSDGRHFWSSDDWTDYLLGKLTTGAWKIEN